jgi:ethanolamine utilization protein EutL
MDLDLIPLKPKVLSVKLLARPDQQLLDSFGVSSREDKSLGLITCDMDDALFAALDECTKSSQVNVIFAKSFYAGSKHASGPLSGEAIGIIEGPDDQSVRSGIESCLENLEKCAWFYQTKGDLEIAFFPHVISSLGHYLSKESGLQPGDPMAYLIAPPMESIIALDEALKAADVKLVKHFKPPTETNFGGAYLTGSLDEVEAAARAFAETLVKISQRAFDL